MRYVWLAFTLTSALVMPAYAADNAPRWSEARAKIWYAHQRWLVGSNYLPSNAVNQLEMWQADTFDPARIDLEFAWAQKLGMNTMRVFLHDLLWKQDAEGFKKRIDVFLTVAAKHGIKPLFVFFDSCWDPRPMLGPQRMPTLGVHNSGWMQSPGAATLDDPSQYSRLEAYVKDIVGTFAKDDRILGWDVWNEPDNKGGGGYYAYESEQKLKRVRELLPQVFAWARSQNPTQPLTSAVWHDDDDESGERSVQTNWGTIDGLSPIERTQLEQSDIISFHSYEWPEKFLLRVKHLQVYGRPVICTEYMARSAGSTIDGVLPLGKKLNVGMYNWGFVDGKEQTRFPWDSWDKPYATQPPVLWFHDLLHRDGKPYRKREASVIRALAESPKGVVPPQVYDVAQESDAAIDDSLPAANQDEKSR